MPLTILVLRQKNAQIMLDSQTNEYFGSRKCFVSFQAKRTN